mmetsp:Transcript_67284/g.109088  ORF Transcript_67284/g.109088 Transcript_67284/m.109088 type:complete len:90 (-) Transcript_67284:812-1081(-)
MDFSIYIIHINTFTLHQASISGEGCIHSLIDNKQNAPVHSSTRRLGRLKSIEHSAKSLAGTLHHSTPAASKVDRSHHCRGDPRNCSRDG